MLFEVVPAAGKVGPSGCADAPFMSWAGARPPAVPMLFDGWFVIAGLVPFGDGGAESGEVRAADATGCRLFQPDAVAAGWAAACPVAVRVGTPWDCRVRLLPDAPEPVQP